jgi:hypothetical protein
VPRAIITKVTRFAAVVVAIAVVWQAVQSNPQGGVSLAVSQGVENFKHPHWQREEVVDGLREAYAAQIPAGSRVFVINLSDRIAFLFLAQTSVLAQTQLVSDRSAADYEVELMGDLETGFKIQVRQLR